MKSFPTVSLLQSALPALGCSQHSSSNAQRRGLYVPRSHPVVYSGFAESAGQAVEDRLHNVLEKRTLSGLDVNVGGHPGRRNEFRHALENIILVQAHPNDIKFPTRITV